MNFARGRKTKTGSGQRNVITSGRGVDQSQNYPGCYFVVFAVCR
ncbi:MAG TPA: hypothetical protein ACFYD4_12385 [Candidatus Wunengus sp. YC61]